MSYGMFRREQLYNASNVLYTKKLFLELSYMDQADCLFTLRGGGVYDPSKEHLEDFRLLFLSLTKDDPTEMTFALTVFGSWTRWLQIQKCTGLVPYLKELREELAVHLKKEALRVVMDKAFLDKDYHAAKFLLEKEVITEIGENLYALPVSPEGSVKTGQKRPSVSQRKKRKETEDAIQAKAKESLLKEEAARVFNIKRSSERVS